MSGTKDGGKAAANTNKTRYGKDFYARIGAKGGKNGTTGGFFANRELARAAGAKGGKISRRTKAVQNRHIRIKRLVVCLLEDLSFGQSSFQT